MLESPLDSKEIKPVNPKGNQPWIFTGRTDAEAKAPILWPPDVKSWLTGKDPDAVKIEGRRRGDDRGWDGWMASLIQWTWVWENAGRWWRTGKPRVLHSMGSQRVGHDWATEQWSVKDWLFCPREQHMQRPCGIEKHCSLDGNLCGWSSESKGLWKAVVGRLRQGLDDAELCQQAWRVVLFLKSNGKSLGIVNGSHMSFRKFTLAARGRVRREGRIEHRELVRRLLGFSEDSFAVEMERSGESFPGGPDGKESAYNVGDLGLIPESGRSPGEGNGNPLQYSCLENPMDRQTTVHRVTKSNWATNTHCPPPPHTCAQTRWGPGRKGGSRITPGCVSGSWRDSGCTALLTFDLFL